MEMFKNLKWHEIKCIFLLIIGILNLRCKFTEIQIQD